MPVDLHIKTFLLCLLLLQSGRGECSAQQHIEAHRHFAQRLVQGWECGRVGGRSLEEYMRDEKIALIEGDFAGLRSLLCDSTAAIELTLVDGKRYALRLYRIGHGGVTIAYPASYQLIMGVTLMEAEDRLADAIRLAPPTGTVDKMLVDESDLEHMGNGPVYRLKGGSYVISEMCADRYYVREQDGSFSLLYSEDYPAEAMANIFYSPELAGNLQLNVTLVKYGYRTEEFTVPFRQWVAYCMAEGCKAYFGVIRQDGDMVVGMVVMHNGDLGYAHIARLSFPRQALVDPTGVVTARMNSYIPLYNVKKIFDEQE